MCVAVPLEVISIIEKDSSGSPKRGVVASNGVEVEVNLSLIPSLSPGDFVLVHAGFAIQRISPEDAKETLALLEELSFQEDLLPPLEKNES
ncbi:MAG: HypC/HybG/HupF family hydrogenase formation chaperone [Candidatus Ratteibacteria bacterium]|jgi:hydrogenase expression/formation protein HypC